MLRRLVPCGREGEEPAEGGVKLWLRPIDQADARPLARTEGASAPFWSPDGLRRVLRRRQAEAARPCWWRRAESTGRGSSRSRRDMERGLRHPVQANDGGALFRMPASGGEAVPVTRLDRHFLFLAVGMTDTSGIYLGTLDSPDAHRLTPADASGVYLSSGWLLWAHDGTLMAQRLDLDGQALTDGPVTLADPVGVDSRSQSHASPVSVSATGLVAYLEDAANFVCRETWWFRRARDRCWPGSPSADRAAVAEAWDSQASENVLLSSASAVRKAAAKG
jgi:hypothetical protein